MAKVLKFKKSPKKVFEAPKSIDEMAANAYVEYMDTDNQAQILGEHRDAAQEAYISTKKFMEEELGDKIPEYGKEIKDDDLVIDILSEYVTGMIEGVHPSHGIKEHFKNRKFRNREEKFGHLAHLAEQYLGFSGEKMAQLKERIKRNKGIRSAMYDTLGKHVGEGETLGYINTKAYSQTFDKMEYMKPGLIGEWLKGHDKFKQSYDVVDEKKLEKLSPVNAKDLIDRIAMEQTIPKDFLKEYGLERKHHREYKKAA